MTRRAVTLLEMLAALTLLTLVVGAGGAWLIGTARAERAIRTTTTDAIWLDRAAALLRRDLCEALPESIEIDPDIGVIRLVAPSVFDDDGEKVMPRPSWHRIEWSFDPATRSLLRDMAQHDPSWSRSPDSDPRMVLSGVNGWTIRPVESLQSEPRAQGVRAFEISIAFGGAVRMVRFEGRGAP